MIYALELLSIIPILGGLILYLILIIFGAKSKNVPTKKETKKPTIAFLIPARNESKVIERLLQSIQEQTVPIKMKDVYVIIEDKEDPTKKITEKYGGTVLYRTTNIHRKGYALDEAVKQILPQHYDLYFIFDADNILDSHYVEKMLPSYYEGYDIALGYRNCKNGNANVIAAASTLIFSIINTLLNKKRKKNHKNVTISGTGFFIKGKYIDQWQGYPFHTLTEDYELSLYAMKHNLKTDYVENAIYYDEQPTTYKQTVIQRKRWVRGYFEARAIYIRQLLQSMKENKVNRASKWSEVIGIIPIILLLLGIGWYLFVRGIEVLIALLIQPSLVWDYLSMIIYLFLFVYFVLLLVTLWALFQEKDKLNLSWKMKLKVLFYHPIFLLGYIPIAISLLFHQDVTWEPIEHKQINIE